MLYIWSAFDFIEWVQKKPSLPYEQTFSVMVIWFLYQIWLNTEFLHQEYCFKFYIGKKMYMWFTFACKRLLFLFIICLLFVEKHSILSEKRKKWELF